MSRAQQPGEADFKSILPEEIDWKPFAAFPPSVRPAVLVGNPTEAAPYVVPVRVPAGVKIDAAHERNARGRAPLGALASRA